MATPPETATIDLKSKTVLVVDRGLFVELAVRLAREFGHVLYWSDWKSAFPKTIDYAPGTGIEEIERVSDLFDAIREADLIVFPDIYDGDLQTYLRESGYRVWGAGNSEHLELDRVNAKDICESLGLETPGYELIEGLSALRERVDATEDQWLKISTYRGDFETYHHVTPFATQTFLDVVQDKLGPLAEKAEFILEEGVEGIEVAYDGYSVDGQFPDQALWGVEVKDRGYVGRIVPYGELPKQIIEVNEKFAPVLKEDQCRSFMSFEMRVRPDGVPVVIDPCLRCGNPPTELWMELYENLGEIFWHGAEGNLVQPRFAAKAGAMLVMHATSAAHHWVPLNIPDEVRQWVKVRMRADVDGNTYYVPSEYEMIEIGAVVAIGDTIEEAIELVKQRAELVEAYTLDIRLDVLDGALEAMTEMETELSGK